MKVNPSKHLNVKFASGSSPAYLNHNKTTAEDIESVRGELFSHPECIAGRMYVYSCL